MFTLQITTIKQVFLKEGSWTPLSFFVKIKTMKGVRFIICNIQREKEIINMVEKNVEFFKELKIKFTWPKKLLEEEYEIGKYKKYKKKLESKWTKKDNEFIEKLACFFRESSGLNFIIEISNYGPMGFYNARKNIITINMNNPNNVNTIKHEMIHILVEPFIREYNINHGKKEMIVNTVKDIIS